jgi:hypothetical protein
MAAEPLILFSSCWVYWPVTVIDPFTVVRLTIALPVPMVVVA